MPETSNRVRPIFQWLRCRLNTACSALAMVILSTIALPGHALMGAVDDVPASTLLFPYFEVDLDNPTGTTTLINITNASATAILGHVTIWTDLGVPLLMFDTYLTGFDVASINLRDILVDGTFPQDASAGQDPTDQLSPRGPSSQDINFASCSGSLPKKKLAIQWTAPTTTTPYFSSVESLQKELTGKPSTRQTTIDPASRINCTGHDYNDRIARGYITVDTVSACNFLSAVDGPAYGTFITSQNVMLGDYMIVNSAANQLHLGNAAHIEANIPGSTGFSGITGAPSAALPAGSYTFYGRYFNWQTTADGREPLATNWSGMGATGHTDAIVWRDTKTAYNLSTSFSCPASTGAPPGGVAWQPLGHEQLLAFDTQEAPVTPLGVFGFATGRYGLGSAAMAIPSSNKLGWIFANLNTSIPGISQPASDPAALQGFVTFSRRPEGSSFSGASGAVGFSMDSGLAPNHVPVN